MTLIRKSFPIFLLSLLILPTLYAQRLVITGKVTDNNGKPIPYALVELKNAKQSQTPIASAHSDSA